MPGVIIENELKVIINVSGIGTFPFQFEYEPVISYIGGTTTIV